jgi:anthranilate phosphoribosyltransferase
MIRRVLKNEPGPARDIVMLNAGAAIYACGLVASLMDGVARAGEVLGNGKAGEALDKLIRVSNAI